MQVSRFLVEKLLGYSPGHAELLQIIRDEPLNKLLSFDDLK